jgi:hypothetical protein
VLLPVELDELVERVAERMAERLAERVPSTEPEPLLSSPELAKRLGCSRAKVHDLALEPDAPVIWLGDSRRWNYVETVAWLKARGRK